MDDAVRKLSLSIEVDSDLLRALKVAAAESGTSVHGYVLRVLQGALSAQEEGDWSRLSEPAFARDWSSEGDSAYDQG